jgi:hypothetical protein
MAGTWAAARAHRAVMNAPAVCARVGGYDELSTEVLAPLKLGIQTKLRVTCAFGGVAPQASGAETASSFGSTHFPATVLVCPCGTSVVPICCILASNPSEVYECYQPTCEQVRAWEELAGAHVGVGCTLN